MSNENENKIKQEEQEESESKVNEMTRQERGGVVLDQYSSDAQWIEAIEENVFKKTKEEMRKKQKEFMQEQLKKEWKECSSLSLYLKKMKAALARKDWQEVRAGWACREELMSLKKESRGEWIRKERELKGFEAAVREDGSIDVEWMIEWHKELYGQKIIETDRWAMDPWSGTRWGVLIGEKEKQDRMNKAKVLEDQKNQYLNLAEWFELKIKKNGIAEQEIKKLGVVILRLDEEWKLIEEIQKYAKKNGVSYFDPSITQEDQDWAREEGWSEEEIKGLERLNQSEKIRVLGFVLGGGWIDKIKQQEELFEWAQKIKKNVSTEMPEFKEKNVDVKAVSISKEELEYFRELEKWNALKKTERMHHIAGLEIELEAKRKSKSKKGVQEISYENDYRKWMQLEEVWDTIKGKEEVLKKAKQNRFKIKGMPKIMQLKQLLNQNGIYGAREGIFGDAVWEACERLTEIVQVWGGQESRKKEIQKLINEWWVMWVNNGVRGEEMNHKILRNIAFWLKQGWAPRGSSGREWRLNWNLQEVGIASKMMKEEEGEFQKESEIDLKTLIALYDRTEETIGMRVLKIPSLKKAYEEEWKPNEKGSAITQVPGQWMKCKRNERGKRELWGLNYDQSRGHGDSVRSWRKVYEEWGEEFRDEYWSQAREGEALNDESLMMSWKVIKNWLEAVSKWRDDWLETQRGAAWLEDISQVLKNSEKRGGMGREEDRREAEKEFAQLEHRWLMKSVKKEWNEKIQEDPKIKQEFKKKSKKVTTRRL